jgi:rhodanese-related sulfurtransferase
MFSIIKSIFTTPSITAAEVKGSFDETKSIILDVREMGERAMKQIPGSIHIPFGELNTRMVELNSNKNKQIICHCASGARSARATTLLNKNGFNAVNMLGGIGAYK